MTKEKKIKILMADGNTESEAIKCLKKDTVIYEDFEKYFDDYASDLCLSDSEIEIYKKMIETKKPVEDWAIVEEEGKTYYIQYGL